MEILLKYNIASSVHHLLKEDHKNIRLNFKINSFYSHLVLLILFGNSPIGNNGGYLSEISNEYMPFVLLKKS